LSIAFPKLPDFYCDYNLSILIIAFKYLNYYMKIVIVLLVALLVVAQANLFTVPNCGPNQIFDTSAFNCTDCAIGKRPNPN
jgi:hypothetical protein